MGLEKGVMCTPPSKVPHFSMSLTMGTGGLVRQLQCLSEDKRGELVSKGEVVGSHILFKR